MRFHHTRFLSPVNMEPFPPHKVRQLWWTIMFKRVCRHVRAGLVWEMQMAETSESLCRFTRTQRPKFIFFIFFIFCLSIPQRTAVEQILGIKAAAIFHLLTWAVTASYSCDSAKREQMGISKNQMKGGKWGEKSIVCFFLNWIPANWQHLQPFLFFPQTITTHSN